MHERIAGRRLRLGLFEASASVPHAPRIFPSGVDLVVGRENGANLVVPSWVGPNAMILEGGHLLHLGPAMRIHMCHDDGEDRVVGEYEELAAAGVTFPIAIQVSRFNLRLQAVVSLLGWYLSQADHERFQSEEHV